MVWTKIVFIPFYKTVLCVYMDFVNGYEQGNIEQMFALSMCLIATVKFVFSKNIFATIKTLEAQMDCFFCLNSHILCEQNEQYILR